MLSGADGAYKKAIDGDGDGDGDDKKAEVIEIVITDEPRASTSKESAQKNDVQEQQATETDKSKKRGKDKMFTSEEKKRFIQDHQANIATNRVSIGMCFLVWVYPFLIF